ncbi:mucin-2 [Eurosta solidaginis]|uniref:mucin-2 n=1 Tax=Eurosta solidaginis TaxID=178769 RepID=UPI0035310FF1
MTRQQRMFITPTTSALAAYMAICLLTLAHAADKWSRQLEPSSPGVSDSFDWVPVAQPVDGSAAKDRSGNGRVLTYSQAFPPNGRFGDLPKPHNTPPSQQHPFDFPYQFQRFSNQPPPPRSQLSSPFGGPTRNSPTSLQSGEPTSQSFFKFEMPFRGDGSNRGGSGGPSSLQTGYQIQHTFGGGAQATLFSSPLFNQQPVFPPEFHPISQKPQQQPLQKPLPQQNFIEDTFSAKNVYRESKPNPTQQSLQSVTPQVFPAGPNVEQFFDLNKPSSFFAQPTFQQSENVPSGPFQQSDTAPTAPASAPTNNDGSNQQDVQLLYVPFDTLFNQQQKPESQAFEANKYNLNPANFPTVNPFQINQFYTQDSLGSLDQQNYFTTSAATTTSRPKTTTKRPANVFQNYASNLQFTTPRPKPKAHQPPLAMFLVRNTARPTQSDVVSALRHSNEISVIDAPTKKIPEIFVGPAGMATPDGYVKFDLPYLSQLTQTRELREVPFFVAPLSYRTPNGFNKILLPEPHVGSIVINLGQSGSVNQEVASQSSKPNVVYSQNEINQYQPVQSTQRPRPHRVKQPAATKDYYPSEPVPQKNRDQFEVTTQRATLAPTRGEKFNYYYNQDAIHEVSSPKVTKQDRPKKKRPQNVQKRPIEQATFAQTINNPYAQFQPAQSNQIANDDIYKIQYNRPAHSPSTSTSTSTTSTTSTTTSTTAAPTYYTFNNNGQVEFQNANGGQLYTFDSIPKEPAEPQAPRYTTHPPSSTTAEEEYHMKQYFRQQDAFRNRPQIVSPTNPPFEQVHYTPVDLDYGRDVNTPSTTTSSTQQLVTYYSPSQPAVPAQEDAYNAVSPQQIDTEDFQQTEHKPHRKQPSNHRPSYNLNEIPDSTIEYEPNPYHVPSELPPLTPNLPGLVNNLIEKEKQNAISELATTTPIQPETELPTRPTRRPIHRVRKPVVTKVSSSVSYSETESTTRRPVQRVRRPFGSRATVSTTASTSDDGAEEQATPSSTRRPSSAARNPLIRNPNRIRYQPTTEERQSLTPKQRKKYGGNSGKDEDLEYQRDVLKQNYPVIKPLKSRTQSSQTAIPSSYATNFATETPTSEPQQVYTVTPSNTVESNDQTFPAGILEPMQIAQQYSQYTKDNFGPGYFPNQEDLSPTEPIIRNEINPVYTTLPTTTTPATTTTTTTEEPQVTTKRSPFARRNYPRLRTTTTEIPTTTTPETETKSSLRPRVPPRKVIRVRTRTRRPQTTSSTSSPAKETEGEEPKNSFRKINRFNQDLYENEATQPQRRRQRPSFKLDGQETQWSPTLKYGSNHFKPTNPKEQNKDDEHKYEDEPQIVTLGPNSDKNAENFEVNISASLGEAKPTIKEPNLKPEKSFAELLEEVMGKAPEEKPLTSAEETSTRPADGTFFESQKTTIFNRINRRNKFKKLITPATQNNDSFETAESQGLGSQLLNSFNAKEKSSDEIVKELATTTSLTPAPVDQMTAPTPTTAPSPPVTTMYTEEPTTSQPIDVTSYATTLAITDAVDKTTMTPTKNEAEAETYGSAENATRRMDVAAVDDLESQPSIFSEVKRQLHDLFAIEESEDHAVTAALAAVGKRRQEYMNIKRTKPDTTTEAMNAELLAVTEPTSAAAKTDGKVRNPLHKNLMDQVVYATSTSTKETAETEICYRGRCIRSEDLPPNHKLN